MIDEKMTQESYSAIEKSLGPGEEILWHSSPDPESIAAAIKIGKIAVLCLGTLEVLFIGHPIFQYFNVHHLERSKLYGVTALVIAANIIRYLLVALWSTRFLSSRHYVLTDQGVIDASLNGKSTYYLPWGGIKRISVVRNSAQWHDLVFVPWGWSAPLRFRHVPDAWEVYKMANTLWTT